MSVDLQAGLRYDLKMERTTMTAIAEAKMTFIDSFCEQPDTSPVHQIPERIEWFRRYLDFSDDFFSRLLRVPPGTLPPFLTSEQEEVMEALSNTLSHILSWRNFRLDDIKSLLDFVSPDNPETVGSNSPPWRGSSLRQYIRDGGVPAMKNVDKWILCLRYGGPYTLA